MKQLFSLNVNTNQINGEEFILRKTDTELTRKSDETSDTLHAYQKKSGVPLWYSIIKYIFLIAAVACLPAFLRRCLDNGFDDAYNGAAWALYAGAAGLLIGLVMFLIEGVRFKKVAQSPEVNEFLSGMGELNNRIKENLHIPENCADIDVFCRPVKLKNGKEKRGNHFFSYFNVSLWVFKEGENLCFADISGVYGIPLSSITEIVLNKKSAMVPQWNKDEPIKNEKYKKYVKVNNYGMYFIKPHYSVRFTRHGEEWEVLVPAYDIDAISELTGKYPAV